MLPLSWLWHLHLPTKFNATMSPLFSITSALITPLSCHNQCSSVSIEQENFIKLLPMIIPKSHCISNPKYTSFQSAHAPLSSTSTTPLTCHNHHSSVSIKPENFIKLLHRAIPKFPMSWQIQLPINPEYPCPNCLNLGNSTPPSQSQFQCYIAPLNSIQLLPMAIPNPHGLNNQDYQSIESLHSSIAITLATLPPCHNHSSSISLHWKFHPTIGVKKYVFEVFFV